MILWSVALALAGTDYVRHHQTEDTLSPLHRQCESWPLPPVHSLITVSHTTHTHTHTHPPTIAQFVLSLFKEPMSIRELFTNWITTSEVTLFFKTLFTHLIHITYIHVYTPSHMQSRPCPESEATFLSRITWWWQNGQISGTAGDTLSLTMTWLTSTRRTSKQWSHHTSRNAGTTRSRELGPSTHRP